MNVIEYTNGYWYKFFFIQMDPTSA